MTNHSLKPLLLISLALILLLLTAGCLDDLSSTLPPCCDGACNMTKTSVITVDHSYDWPDLSSKYYAYVIDSDDTMYAWENCLNYVCGQPELKYDPYNNHNVTFSYEMVNGHRHITGIIEDHDAEPECECRQCACFDNPDTPSIAVNMTVWVEEETHMLEWYCSQSPENCKDGYGVSGEYIGKQYCLHNPNDCGKGDAGTSEYVTVVVTPVSTMSQYQCVQKCCGCDE